MIRRQITNKALAREWAISVPGARITLRLALVVTLSAAAFAALAQTNAVRAETSTPASTEYAMRTKIAAAWSDATAVWNQLLGERTYDSDIPQINFVKAIRPSHCYGLYVGTGPVYCSGNNTVFVSTEEMTRLSQRLGSAADAGMAFLVAHELGHHVQKITGRFRTLQAMARANPEHIRQLSRRFELEADCLAGVWAGNSPAFAKLETVRTGIVGTLDAIGDDKVRASEGKPIDPETFTHGTSEQRRKWYNVGLEQRTIAACSVLEAPDF